MRKPVIDSNIGVMEFTIKKPRNSFFSKLSELSSAKILLEIMYIPGMSRYLVLAYSYNRNINKNLPLLIQNDRYITKSKIEKVKYFEDRSLHIIIAIKSQCEFLKLAEDNNISILSPYIIDKGHRIFIALGEKKDLELYLDAVTKYYGEENVKYNNISSSDRLSCIIVKKSLLNLITEKLTDMELNVLMLAYKNRYFEYPKGSSQETIGALLGLSKITINIHMRKALKKIIEEIVKAYG